MFRKIHEAHLPTQQKKATDRMRLPHQNENRQRAPGHQPKTPTGTQKANAGVIRYGLPKQARVLDRVQFLKIMKAGTKVCGSSLVIFYRRKTVGLARLGITVSKKHGKAHERNYFKRLVREAFRYCRLQLPLDIEINVQPTGKKEIPLSLPVMIDDFLHFSKRLAVPCKEKEV